MAEGGEYEIPDVNLMDFPDDDDQEANTTQPFQPGKSSTPYHGGEQHEMQIMLRENSGLPSYDERAPLITDEYLSRRLATLRENDLTGLLDIRQVPDARVNPLSEEEKEEQIRRVKRLIKARYPYANVDNLVISYSTKKPMELVVKGPRGGETKIVLADGSDLQKSFTTTSFIKKELGPQAESVIQKTSEDINKRKKKITRFTRFREAFKRQR